MSLRTLLLRSSILAFAAVMPACSSSEAADEDDEGALGLEDSGKIVPTAQTDLLLYQGYNTLFDQGTKGCVSYGNVAPQIGDIGVDVKITFVKSRDELARELGFDTDLSFKLPKTGADARAQVMNSFKRNSSSTTLLVRVGSYYFIDAGQRYSLTNEASALLERSPNGFLQACGDTVITKLQYRAEVIGLMRFDTNDQEKTAKASGNVGVTAPSVGTIADAQAKVGGTYNQMKASTKASMNLELYTQGFAPDGNISLENLQGDSAMGRLSELLKKMAESIKGDRDADVKAIAQGKIPETIPGQAAPANPVAIQRRARLGAISFHPYSKEGPGLAAVTKLTEDAGKFLHEIGDVQGRLENTYFEEVNAFLTAQDQETYNLTSSAKLTSAELEPIAQKWSGDLKPSPGVNTIAGKLKDAELACVRMGLAGDISKCKKTGEISKLVDDGTKQLEQYDREGRIVRMNLLYGSAGEVTVDKAKAACDNAGGRLPYDTEMQWLRPALAAKGGFAWVLSQQCPNRVGIFTGAKQATCYDGWYMDWYDGLLDATGLSKRAAPVFCVAAVGPRGVLPRPGE